MDSRHCKEEADGSFHLNLYENVELADGHACYIDDVSISGTSPNCDTHTRLFLYEFTPKGWDFTGLAQGFSSFDAVRANATALMIVPHTPTPASPRAFHCALPGILGDVHFDVDDTQLHWEGEYTAAGGTEIPVQGQYSYLSGEVVWTAGMHSDIRH